MQTKLKNLRTVVGTENKFRSEDRVEHATLEIRAMQLSLHGLKISILFMNIENYEQISSSAEDVRDSYAILLPEQIVGRNFLVYWKPYLIDCKLSLALVVHLVVLTGL